ncbi:hypothetical protein J6500_16220 [Bradyrhizobium sp. WSM 1704]|uniref:hypothetical protein n=1 Tax=Bradyrhizobium semiaridum TaxID=2821404 RepID=UPI001CE354DF|nr:hypothetical protein [Bradyrhizobium semiaridum]MCA6123428.1 hypothetical protein [Bradyrhizobium semiaridum]
MSETSPPTLPPSPPAGATPPLPAPRQRHGCATAFMVLFGIILLLPGLCALIFGVTMISETRFDPAFAALVLLGLFVGLGGVILIRAAIKGPQG